VIVKISAHCFTHQPPLGVDEVVVEVWVPVDDEDVVAVEVVELLPDPLRTTVTIE
jgi:hypothetical protein